jgi:hypothetical protein
LKRNDWAFICFLISGIISGIGLVINEFGPYHGGLTAMLAGGYTIGMGFALYFVYKTTSLNLYGLRKTPYYQYGSMGLEWYISASPTTCGCCMGPFVILAIFFVLSYLEYSLLVFTILIVSAIFGMLGGIAYKPVEEYRGEQPES